MQPLYVLNIENLLLLLFGLFFFFQSCSPVRSPRVISLMRPGINKLSVSHPLEPPAEIRATPFVTIVLIKTKRK